MVEGGRERVNPADTSHDQVLLLDDVSGSFVPMGGDDDYSGDSVVPEMVCSTAWLCVCMSVSNVKLVLPCV